MADAQIPVLTDEQIAGVEAHLYGTGRARMRMFARVIEAAVLVKLAAQAPAQPDRAVMQQALDALRGMIDYFAPNGWGDAVPDIANARAAIAALSASIGQVSEPRDG